MRIYQLVQKVQKALPDIDNELVEDAVRFMFSSGQKEMKIGNNFAIRYLGKFRKAKSKRQVTIEYLQKKKLRDEVNTNK